VSLTAWRIFKKKLKRKAFSGEGARRYGGRWNSKGTAVLYAAGSASLAALEMLVHLRAEHLLESYFLAPITFGEELVEVLEMKQLPSDWRDTPGPRVLQELGDKWAAERRSAVLRVPSVIIASEHNYLLNPLHRDFRKCKIGKPQSFVFDSRLKG